MEALISAVLDLISFELFIIIIIVGIVSLVSIKKNTSASQFHYASKKYLLSRAERSFMGILESAIPKNYKICPKVRVGDVVRPITGGKSYLTALNKVNRKHFDYVICDGSSYSIIGVIELNDQSHNKKSRQERDDFITLTCSQAGIPCVFIKAQKNYQIQKIKAVLSEKFNFTS